MFSHEDLPSRRRFFKLAALSTAAAGLAGTGFAALAHGRRRGGAPLDPAEMAERIDRFLKHMYVEIDATDAQKQKIDPIVKQAAQELQPLRAKVREARREGIHPFCLTVDKDGNDYLRTMMDDFSYEVLAEVSLLPQRLPQLYKKLTT